ncbi:MAG: DUF58 domain-containing protein [Pseudomonadota bacterium]
MTESVGARAQSYPLRRGFYRLFRRLHATNRRLRDRFTPLGYFVLSVFIAGAVFGIDVRKSLAYQLLALAGGIIAVGLVSTLRFRPALSIERSLPRFAMLGQPLRYRVTVTNQGSHQLTGLEVRERMAEPPPAFADFVHAKEPGFDRRNAFDRYVGYPRWVWLLRRARGALTQLAALPSIPPGESINHELTITPLRRGRLRFEGVTAMRPDSLGVARAIRRIKAPGSLLVLPALLPCPTLTLPGGTELAYQRFAATRGDEDFFQLRPFQPGDSPRRIHWPSLARYGTPYIREMSSSGQSPPTIVLDNRSVGYDGQGDFERAVSLAASITHAFSENDELALSYRVGRRWRVALGRDAIFEALALVTEDGSSLPGAVDVDDLPPLAMISAECAIVVAARPVASVASVVEHLSGVGFARALAVVDAPQPTSPDHRVFQVPPGREAIALAQLAASVDKNGSA